MCTCASAREENFFLWLTRAHRSNVVKLSCGATESMSHSAANWIMEDKQGQKRKYVLFKKEGADSGPKQCAFFSSDAGCRNSSSCMFVHCKDGKTYPTKAGSAAPKAAPIVALSEPSIPVTSAVAPTSHKKAKVVSTSSVPSAESTPVTKGSKQQAAEDEDSSLLFGAVNVALNGYTPVSASLRRGPPLADKKTATIEVLGHQHTQQILLTSGTTHATLGAKSLQKNLKNKFDSVAAGSAVEFEKPVGTTAGPGVARPLAPAISAPKGAAPTHEAVQPIDDGDEKKLLREALSLVSAVKAGSAVAKPKTLAETIHPDAVDWAPLVELTRASPKYEKDYLTQTDLQGWCSSQLGNRYFINCPNVRQCS